MSASQAVDNYWIRALPVVDGLAFTSPYAGGINSAILRYIGAPIAEPSSSHPVGVSELVEANLVPYSNPAAPGLPSINAPDVYALNMQFTLNFTDFQFDLNGRENKLPTVPVLLQILSGVQSAQSLLPAGSGQYFQLPKNTVVQLSFPGGGPAPTTRHPMHLHGHAFSVIRSAGQSTYNFVNPPRRDVVSMG